MQIPKKVDRLLKKRTKLAQELQTVSSEVDGWLEANGFNLMDNSISDAVLTGAMIYCEPGNAEEVVRRAIIKHDA